MSRSDTPMQPHCHQGHPQAGAISASENDHSPVYLMAYGNIYSNQGAMTPGAGRETADGMSEDKIEQITGLMRRERYRFAPARRT